jgi:hypothetical protein
VRTTLPRARRVSTKAIAGTQDFAEFAAGFIRKLRSEYPNLAERAEQHLAAPGDGGHREFEFGLDLILDGLELARP